MKKIKVASPLNFPGQFFFRCEKCGAYPVSESTARKFLTEKLKKRLDEALKKGAHGAILEFQSGCPTCKSNNPDAIIKLSALKIRIN